MPIDPSKLRTFLATAEPRVGRRTLVVVQPTIIANAAVVAAEARRHLIHATETSVEEAHRLLDPGVAYMEILDKASGFSCGTCRSFTFEMGSRCENEKVRAPVSGDHGCCNLWVAFDPVRVTFPPLE